MPILVQRPLCRNDPRLRSPPRSRLLPPAVVRGTLYAANAGLNSITAFKDHRGQLTISDATAATTGAGPVDIATSRNGHFVYQLTGGSGEVNQYRRGPDGSLTLIGTVDTGLGAASGNAIEGIAAS